MVMPDKNKKECAGRLERREGGRNGQIRQQLACLAKSDNLRAQKSILKPPSIPSFSSSLLHPSFFLLFILPNCSLTSLKALNFAITLLLLFWVLLLLAKFGGFMASKVPKFGAWEGGENFTVYFDNARKGKHNGPMINPNDPLENQGMFSQNGAPAHVSSTNNKVEAKGQSKVPQVPSTNNKVEAKGQSKVPQFGDWDKEDNVGYTMYFEKARKNKSSGGPTVTEKEPQVKRDARAQTRPTKIKPEPQEPRSKVPQFGGWESGGEAAYTACFDNVIKNKNGSTNAEEPSNEPKMNREVASRNKPPPAQDVRSKLPEFGAWNGGEAVAYTAQFDNVRKNKTGGAGPIFVEPQLNRDVGAATKARPDQKGTKEDGHLRNPSKGSAASMAGSERQGRQTPGGQSPLHPKGGKTQSKHGNRGNQNPEKGTTIPPFGGWNEDPSKADQGYTGTFERAFKEKHTPLNQNVPPSYRMQTPQSNREAQKGCCFPWF